MADSMTLHLFIGCPTSLSCMITSKAMNLPVKYEFYSKQEQLLQNKVRSLNPKCQLPILETSEGVIINYEAILRYLAGLKQHLSIGGQSAFDKAQVDQWLINIASELKPVLGINNTHKGIGGWTKESHEGHKLALVKNLKHFEEHLSLKTYFVGNNVTLADIHFAAVLMDNRSFVLEKSLLNGLPNVARHFKYMTSTSFFEACVGKTYKPSNSEIPLADSNACKTYSDAHNLICPVAGVQKKAVEPKKKETKKAEPKKEAPKVEKPEKTAEQLAEEEATAKSGTWFYDYKTLFTNSTDRNGAIDKLFEDLDAKRFSFWTSNYDKLSTECKDFTRTTNMVSFFLRGLDGLNKDCLGCFGIYGKEDDHDLKGLWMFKGTDLHKIVKEHNSAEYHNFTKLPTACPNTKAKVKEYWLNIAQGSGLVDGQTPLDVKLFK